MDSTDFKKLWLEVSEEKRVLQLEVRRLQKDSDHWRNRSEELERMLRETRDQRDELLSPTDHAN